MQGDAHGPREGARHVEAGRPLPERPRRSRFPPRWAAGPGRAPRGRADGPAPGSHRRGGAGRRRGTLRWLTCLARDGSLPEPEGRGTQRREVRARTERPRSVTVAGWPPCPVRGSDHEEVEAQEGNGRSRRHEKSDPRLDRLATRIKALKTEKAGASDPRYRLTRPRVSLLQPGPRPPQEERQEGTPAVTSRRGCASGANPWRAEPQERHLPEKGRTVARDRSR